MEGRLNPETKREPLNKNRAPTTSLNFNSEAEITPSGSTIVPQLGGWRLDLSYAQLPPRFYAPVQPTPLSSPRLVLLHPPLASAVGLDPQLLAGPANAGWFTGNSPPPGAPPIAQAYAGHQFGNFVMLGYGRAILL